MLRVLLKASWHCEAAAAACGSCESSSEASVIKQALKPKPAPEPPLLVSNRLSCPATGPSAAPLTSILSKMEQPT